MALQSTLSTPVNLKTQTIASDAPTGTWQHPRFDEIHQRLQASTFGGRNIKAVLWNALLLAALMFIPQLAPVSAIMDAATMKAVVHYGYYPLNMSRLILIFNIIYAFSPILNQKDDLSDIPLTPSQRALLGLEPNSRPATPGSQYITPPRYGRSSTPGSGSRSKSVSPFSGKNSLGAIGTGISYSPSASPLFQKTFSRDVTRRLSYSTPSPLGLNRAANESSSSLIAPAPSPTIGKGASVGLNSRWLYEKGRSGSGMRSIYT